MGQNLAAEVAEGRRMEQETLLIAHDQLRRLVMVVLHSVLQYAETQNAVGPFGCWQS